MAFNSGRESVSPKLMYIAIVRRVSLFGHFTTKSFGWLASVKKFGACSPDG